MIRCPECKGVSRARRPRSAWMRMVPSLLLFQCDDCGIEFCNLFRWINFRRPTILSLLVFLLLVLLAMLLWQLWGA